MSKSSLNAIENNDLENQDHENVVPLYPDNRFPVVSLRDQYLKEKSLIEQEFGDLEAIRKKLGLSRRKICQLLLVDPSAWTRWTRTKEGAPPHVYQALRWYLLLMNQGGANTTDNTHQPVPYFNASTNLEMENKMLQVSAAYDEQLKKIATEIESLKVNMNFKEEIAGDLGDKIAKTVSDSLSKIQIQVQQAAQVQPPIYNPNTEILRMEQVRAQNQVQMLEQTIQSLKAEISGFKKNSNTSNGLYAAPAQTESSTEYLNRLFITLMVFSFIGGIAYAFVKYF